MSSESLSGTIRISGGDFPPRAILTQLLGGVARSLGPAFLGHIKGIVRFSDGVLYASTVGLPPEVNFQSFGQEPQILPQMAVELTCVALDLPQRRLQQAVDEALNVLSTEYLIEGSFYDRTHQH